MYVCRKGVGCEGVRQMFVFLEREEGRGKEERKKDLKICSPEPLENTK